MKLKIWSEESAIKSNENQLFLTLIKYSECDDIGLVVCDYKGDFIKNGTILVIDQDIKGLVIFNELDEKVPLKTDFYGEPLFISESEKRERDAHEIKLHVMGKIMEDIEQKKQESCLKH